MEPHYGVFFHTLNSKLWRCDIGGLVSDVTLAWSEIRDTAVADAWARTAFAI